MVWNPYQDQKNRAYSSILTSLFPEQTKSVSRIILWSIVFLADLIAVLGGGFYFGLLDHASRVTAGLLLVACVGLFWLQGKIWYGIPKLFRKKEETWL